jgi:hypothetical protein
MFMNLARLRLALAASLALAAALLVAQEARAQPGGPDLSRRIEFMSAPPMPFHVRFVYMIASDRVDRHFDINGVIADRIRRMQEWMAPRADGMQVRIVYRNGTPEVLFHRLKETMAEVAAQSTALESPPFVNRLRVDGALRPYELLVMIYDGPGGDGCGQAPIPPSATDGVANIWLESVEGGGAGLWSHANGKDRSVRSVVSGKSAARDISLAWRRT